MRPFCSANRAVQLRNMQVSRDDLEEAYLELLEAYQELLGEKDTAIDSQDLKENTVESDSGKKEKNSAEELQNISNVEMPEFDFEDAPLITGYHDTNGEIIEKAIASMHIEELEEAIKAFRVDHPDDVSCKRMLDLISETKDFNGIHLEYDSFQEYYVITSGGIDHFDDDVMIYGKVTDVYGYLYLYLGFDADPLFYMDKIYIKWESDSVYDGLYFDVSFPNFDYSGDRMIEYATLELSTFYELEDIDYLLQNREEDLQIRFVSGENHVDYVVNEKERTALINLLKYYKLLDHFWSMREKSK